MITPKLSRRNGNERHRMRAWSAVLCALFVLAQIASLAHDALNAHAVCAEHGELVHVAHLPGVTGATSLASRHVVTPSLRSAGPPHAPDHEHCSLATLNRERTLELHPCTLVSIAPASVSAPTPVQIAEVHCSIPLLRLAPKQSPPL